MKTWAGELLKPAGAAPAAKPRPYSAPATKTGIMKEIAQQLERLSSLLRDRETAKKMLADCDREIDHIRRGINDNHPLLRTVFGLGDIAAPARKKRAYLAPKRPRSYWMPMLLNQFRGVRVPVHVGVMVEAFKAEGWTRSATNNRVILLKRDGYLTQDEQGRYSLSAKGMDQLLAKGPVIISAKAS